MIMCQTIIHFITSKQLRLFESGYIYYYNFVSITIFAA